MLKKCLILSGALTVLLCLSASVYGQQIFLQEKVRFSYLVFSGNTIKDHLLWLEQEKNIDISYSSVAFNDQKSIQVKEGVYSIEDFLFALLSDFKVSVVFSPPAKILIIPAKESSELSRYLLSGYIKDEATHEVLIGAVVECSTTKQYAVANASGHFSMKLPEGQHELKVNYLGYKPFSYLVEVNGNAQVILKMKVQNDLPIVTISSERINHWNFGDFVDAFKSKEFKSILGECDPVNTVRVMPGIQSGGEGQGNLYVRGGGGDQNLILLEGVPLYEASHTVGIASVFLEESVREASLMKNGFPARYGGRLSSVMDVQLKEGNTENHERVISVGIPGIKFHANGPIVKNKTTYNFSGRASWVNYYIDKFLVSFTNYDEIRLEYWDLVGKITHRFAENHKLSFSFYNGGDRLSLSKTLDLDSVGYRFSSFDSNRLSWSNSVGSAQWFYTPTPRWSFQGQLGMILYKHRSRSSYVFETTVETFTRKDELDILSFADIRTINTKWLADFHASPKHTLKMGFEYLNHVFNPVVKQSTVLLEGVEENILDKDSVILASEWNLFVEDHFKISPRFSLYAGIHANFFSPAGKTYFSLQPRSNLVWKPSKNYYSTVAVTKMQQNIHLLVNLGLGLPSDLWVPSTSKIGPQSAWQYSWSHGYSPDKFHFLQLAAFYKTMQGLLEYQSPVDLFYFFINETQVVPVYNNARDWERNVFQGNGKARGIEFLFQRKNKTVNGWASVTWSKSTRSFPDIDGGKEYPFKYDRTWDINTGCTYNVSPRLSLAASFVYGTGNTFSLSTEEFKSFLGTSIINTASRNNRRLPPFHQASISVNYTKPILKSATMQIQLNVYNVYNRLNAYFIYLYKNPVGRPFYRKVSILPITPSIFFSVKF